jgi:hypothetical protein
MEYYFAKIVFETHLNAPRENNIDVLKKGLESKRITTYRDAKFIFSRINYHTVESNNYVSGQLIKYSDTAFEAVDNETLDIVTNEERNSVIAKCHFIIDLKENILLYSEAKSHINRLSFISRFVDLVNQGLSDSFAFVEVNPITENYTFIEGLKMLEKVSYLRLAITPTNPDADEIIKDMDNTLKHQRVQKKHIIFEGTNEGINLDDKEIRETTVYTDTGYGRGVGHGLDKNGKVRKIYSHKTERQVKTPPIKTSINDMGELLSELDKLLRDREERNGK